MNSLQLETAELARLDRRTLEDIGLGEGNQIHPDQLRRLTPPAYGVPTFMRDMLGRLLSSDVSAPAAR